MVFAIFWAFEYFAFEPVFASQGFGLTLKSFQLDLMALNTVLVAMIGYIFNDWYDQSIDKLNKPRRFLVKYSISSIKIFWLLGILILMVLCLATFLAFSLKVLHWLWIYPFFTFIMWYYASSLKLKGLIGNIIVSFSIAVIPAIIFFAEHTSFVFLKSANQAAANQLIMHLCIFSLMIFLSNLARELVKDIEDAKGDKSQNSSSFFLKKGLRITKTFILVAVLSLLCLEFLLIMQSLWITEVFIYLGFLVLAFLLYIVVKLLKSKEKVQFSNLSLMFKILMIIGLLQVLFLNPH